MNVLDISFFFLILVGIGVCESLVFSNIKIKLFVEWKGERDEWLFIIERRESGVLGIK